MLKSISGKFADNEGAEKQHTGYFDNALRIIESIHGESWAGETTGIKTRWAGITTDLLDVAIPAAFPGCLSRTERRRRQ